jgi:hypothetical protein
MTFDDAVQRILEYWDRQYSDRGGISQPPINAVGLNAPVAPSDERVFVGGALFPRQKKRKKLHRK